MRYLRYRFAHWFFRWIKDEDGDIGLQIAHVLTFIKYKEHTMISFSGNYPSAGEWQGWQSPSDDN